MYALDGYYLVQPHAVVVTIYALAENGTSALLAEMGGCKEEDFLEKLGPQLRRKIRAARRSCSGCRDPFGGPGRNRAWTCARTSHGALEALRGMRRPPDPLAGF